MPRHSGGIACLIVALATTVSLAEVIELTNGSRIEGEILKDGAEIVVIDIGVDVLKIPTDRIKSRSASFDKPGTKAEVKKGDLYSVAKLPLKPTKELANEFGGPGPHQLHERLDGVKDAGHTPKREACCAQTHYFPVVRRGEPPHNVHRIGGRVHVVEAAIQLVERRAQAGKRNDIRPHLCQVSS